MAEKKFKNGILGLNNRTSAPRQRFKMSRKFIYGLNGVLICSVGRCLLIRKFFCTVYNYAGKAVLSIGYWNPERKLR